MISTYAKELYFDKARIHALQIMLCSRMDELLEKLEVPLYKTRKMYYGCCPIHSGDNINALNIYPEGDSVPGYWKCYTKNCHRYFKRTILGFIRGVLSRQRFDWSPMEKSGQRIASFEQSVDWACEFLGKKLKDIDIDRVELEKHSFVSEVKVLTRLPDQKQSNITQVKVRDRLKIPSDYFIKRGWSPQILDKYDVGLCEDKGKPFFNRVVVPIYDNKHEFAVGFTARSVHPKCLSCSLFHPEQLPCPADHFEYYSKWRNSEAYNRDSYLYNYWFAKKFIEESGIAILVEGPGEVWRLEEAGFHIGLGMLGTSLSDQQQVILETSGAMNLIIVTNNDDAGRASDAALKEQLGRAFRLHFPKPEKNDLGESTIEEVQGLIGPIVSKIVERGY